MPVIFFDIQSEYSGVKTWNPISSRHTVPIEWSKITPEFAQINVIIIRIQNVAALTSYRDHTLTPKTNETLKNM